MSRCVIVGAADIRNYEYVKAQLTDGDYFIFCDGGLKHAEALNVSPSLVVGDFDSWSGDPACEVEANDSEGSGDWAGAEVMTLPREKDDTDTFFAAKEALRRGFDDFLLVGVIGNRLDHTLGNISILVMLAGAGAHAVAIDDYSEMEILIGDDAIDVGSAHQSGSPSAIHISPEFSYFSIICLSDKLTGVSITGAKYPLLDATITPAYNFAISNEPLKNATAEISIGSGIALVVSIW